MKKVGHRFKHGESRGAGALTAEYITWCSIIGRCHCPTNHKYPRYGGRGITMCARWRNSFEDFLADMGRRPSSKHSIDRIDNDGNYEPGNCRWATASEQVRNSTTAKLNEQSIPIIWDRRRQGATHDVIAAELGVDRSTISLVLRGKLWSDISERIGADYSLARRFKKVAK